MRLVVVMLIVCIFFGYPLVAENKIAPDLQEKIAGGADPQQKIPVIVLFEGMPSFGELAREYRFLGSKEIIRRQVIRVMKENAESIHYWLKQFCETSAISSKVANFTSIWLVNAVVLDATPQAIREIANQPNVEKILFDEAVPLLLQETSMTWGLEKIQVETAWDYYKGEGVTVAIIDTGINEHLDLKDRLIDGSNYVNENAPRDDHSHGTHCAGTVAGDGSAGTLTGVAPLAQVMAIKVLDSNGNGSWSDLWRAIEETIESDVKVLSMSVGGFAETETRERMRLACRTAIAAGVIPVIAAGNSGFSGIACPGDIPEVITVGATDSEDKIAAFSSRGPTAPWDGETYTKPDICAPGVNILSCSHTTDTYVSKSGTSMATPHVAGLVALLLSAQPELDAPTVKTILEQTAEHLGRSGKNNNYGSGLINAELALTTGSEVNQEQK